MDVVEEALLNKLVQTPSDGSGVPDTVAKFLVPPLAKPYHN